MINKSIFKAYDVRGIYPTDLHEEAAYQIGRAFAKLSNAKNVVVCQDARLSSPALFNALVAGILREGVQVTSIGQLPTECLYFAVGTYDFDGGVMITASHNPKEYNGFKMMKRVGDDIVWIRGHELLDVVTDGEISSLTHEIPVKDIMQDYVTHLFSVVDVVSSKPLKIVVDASNGVMGRVIMYIKEKLPATIIALNFEPDGNFPNHSPNPLEAGAVNQIADQIKNHQADFGIMFDGDADRIFLVDENGHMVSADVVLLLLAKHFLEKNPKKGIAYNLICSRSVPEFVKKWGGLPIRTQVGFVNVREGLMKNDGIMGGELSAHYCFRDYFYCDSGLLAFLTLLQIVSRENKKVSEIVKELSLYAPPFQKNFTIADASVVLEKVKQKYHDGKQDFLDGITVEYEDWWFNLRPSNTEPLLKLTLEATTQEMLELKKNELCEYIDEA